MKIRNYKSIALSTLMLGLVVSLQACGDKNQPQPVVTPVGVPAPAPLPGNPQGDYVGSVLVPQLQQAYGNVNFTAPLNIPGLPVLQGSVPWAAVYDFVNQLRNRAGNCGMPQQNNNPWIYTDYSCFNTALNNPSYGTIYNTYVSFQNNPWAQMSFYSVIHMLTGYNYYYAQQYFPTNYGYGNWGSNYNNGCYSGNGLAGTISIGGGGGGGFGINAGALWCH